MKIRSVTVWRANLDLVRPYTISYKTISAVENVFVRIELESGLYGIGACNPSKPVVGEDLDAAYVILQLAETTDWLVGRDIRHFNQLCAEIQTSFAHSPGTRAALDIALHDAFTRFLDVPLVEFLGQKVYELPTSITIGIKGVQDTLDEAQEYVDRKFRVLKIKTGSSIEEDVERIAKLRERFGFSIALRIDSNQAYNAPQAMELYNKLQPYDIELNEQPLLAANVDSMRILPQDVRQSIAADESLITPQSAFQLAQQPRACGIFNIKLMKCGGITPARAITTIAENSNIDLMWGCNDESVVSITAALHTAFASQSTKYIDLDGSLDLAKDVVSGGFILEDGVMRTSGKAGLGVEVLA
jgi:L-Ala-D/L-Glu epimerase